MYFPIPTRRMLKYFITLKQRVLMSSMTGGSTTSTGTTPTRALSTGDSVPIGGSYQFIDVPMSNCLNSGFNKVYILTQFNSASLNRHLTHTYNISNNVAFGTALWRF